MNQQPMTNDLYLKLSERTEKKFPEGLALSQENAELLHHAMGMCTEAGEFLDQMKKVLIYGKEVDKTNLKEELGDMLWYIAGAVRLLDTSIEIEMVRNIEKLRARFPSKFDAERALVRDLDTERKILENGDKQ